jgi:hypothetical protein
MLEFSGSSLNECLDGTSISVGAGVTYLDYDGLTERYCKAVVCLVCDGFDVGLCTAAIILTKLTAAMTNRLCRRGPITSQYR